MTFDSILWAVGALILVLAMILLAQRALGLAGFAPRATTGGRLAVVEAIALDPRRRLTLVRCDDRYVVLLTGGAQDAVVGWIAPPSSPTGPGKIEQALSGQTSGRGA